MFLAVPYDVIDAEDSVTKYMLESANKGFQFENPTLPLMNAEPDVRDNDISNFDLIENDSGGILSNTDESFNDTEKNISENPPIATHILQSVKYG